MSIKNYNEIEILPNSLVILDLDETIIRFPYITEKWWINTKKAYELIDEKTADARAYNDWFYIINNYNPSLLDEYEFSQLLERIKNTNSTYIIITARNIQLKDITIKHLNNVCINADVYYSSDKGVTINAIKNNYIYNYIIFVDDNEKYIKQVEEINPEIITYFIKHKNLT
jgi:hypothetical protein